MEHLGETLTRLRKHLGKKQEDLANELGIKIRTYQTIESSGTVAKAATKERILKFIAAHTSGGSENTQYIAEEPQPAYQKKAVKQQDSRDYKDLYYKILEDDREREREFKEFTSSLKKILANQEVMHLALGAVGESVNEIRAAVLAGDQKPGKSSKEDRVLKQPNKYR